MKVSVCITIFNEKEETINKLLSVLNDQTLKPDEIIVVNATAKVNLKSEIKNLKIINSLNISRARGRNLAIKKAKNKIIAITDAGCEPNRDWLKKITKPFFEGDCHVANASRNGTNPIIASSDIGGAWRSHNNDIIVAGFYDMPYTNSFQEAIRVYLGILPQKFKDDFMPSTRSVAFNKSVWKLVGNFNEELKGGAEDSEFFYRCVKNNVKIFREKKARVEWSEIKTLNLKLFLKKIYVYSNGDGQANIWWHPIKQFSSHNIKISLIFLRYFIFFILLPIKFSILLVLIFIYLLYPIMKWKNLIKNKKALVWLPIIQVLTDITTMYGFITGTITSNVQKIRNRSWV